VARAALSNLTASIVSLFQYHGQTGGHQYQTFTKDCVPVRDDFFTQATGFQ
jgi:hypothetical protein